jgi:serine/threonine protein kinase
MSLTIDSRFLLGRRIGKGSFGEIHKGEDVTTGLHVAVKLEPVTLPSPLLATEAHIYQTLSGGVGIPAFHFYGLTPTGTHQALVIDLESQSLEEITKSSPSMGISLKSCLMIADQMISRLEWVHRHGLVHRDIKPDNFMMGVGNCSGQVTLIDYGLTRSYLDPHTKQHKMMHDGLDFTGTARYGSLNALRGFDQSRRDDMEAIGYVLIYLLRGTLPWQGLTMKNEKDNVDKTAAMKEAMSPEEICEGLPQEFSDFLNHTRSLAFEEEPPYGEYRRWFRELFIKEGFVYDGVYDWTVREVAGNIGKQHSFCCGAPVGISSSTSNMLSDVAGAAGRAPPFLRGTLPGRASMPPRRCVFGNARCIAVPTPNGRVPRIQQQFSSLPPLMPV